MTSQTAQTTPTPSPASACSDRVFDALRAAVNLARFEQVKSLSALRERMGQLGFEEAEREAALLLWASRQASLRTDYQSEES